MNKTQYKALQSKAREYYKSLNIEDVRKEFLKDNLLIQNNKLEKESRDNFSNFGLELTPSKFCQSSVNMCGNEGECLFTCIVFSGVANMMKSKSFELSNVLKKRIRRTFLFLEDKALFLEKLKLEINFLRASYKNVAIRLNTFSDLPWDSIIDLGQFSGVVFYDYSKDDSQLEGSRKITYSASEKDSKEDLKALLSKKYNVAMVFSKKLPKTWEGFEVIDGDISDDRYNDKKGVVVGLVQKTTMGGKTDSNFIVKGGN